MGDGGARRLVESLRGLELSTSSPLGALAQAKLDKAMDSHENSPNGTIWRSLASIKICFYDSLLKCVSLSHFLWTQGDGIFTSELLRYVCQDACGMVTSPVSQGEVDSTAPTPADWHL